MKRLQEFALEFQKQIKEYLRIHEKYRFHETSKVIEKLRIFGLNPIGFAFFKSEKSGICAGLLTNQNKIEIFKVENVLQSICKFIYSKSIVDQKLLSKSITKGRPLFDLRNNSKLILSDLTLSGDTICNFADIDNTSEILCINSKFKLKISHYSSTVTEIPFLYIGNINKFNRKNAENLFTEITKLALFSSNRQINEIDDAINKLKALIKEFENLILSKSQEREIDKFLERNFVLLELALNLANPIHQPELPDVGLKPDLIAFDMKKEEWVIVDYKLSKYSKLVVGIENRRRFSAKVEELIAQLTEYIEYFDEQKNRELFKRKYNFELQKKPSGIGIIGYIQDEKQKKEFQKIRKNRLKYGLEVLTYNEILNTLKSSLRVITQSTHSMKNLKNL